MSVTKYGQSECNVLWSKCNVLGSKWNKWEGLWSEGSKMKYDHLSW